MTKRDKKELAGIINSLLDDLVYRLKKTAGNNLFSVSLAGSTVYNDLKYNQDIDLLIVLKTIRNEYIIEIKKILNKVSRGELDLEYNPNVPDIKRVFDEISNKYTTKNTTVRYKFTLGNYWGKPDVSKKYTLHLHVIGPHSIKSFNIRLQKYQKVILTNVIHNAKTLHGKSMKCNFPVKINRVEIIQAMQILEKRNNKAIEILDSDLLKAFTISVKNLTKIAMVALESKGIFANRGTVAGDMFMRKFSVPYNNLPKQATYFKKHAETILKQKGKARDLVLNTSALIKETIKALNP